jgi:hypothetical protein
MQHQSWRYLLRWLVRDQNRALGAIPQKDLTARLLSVVTLARWIGWQGLVSRRPGRLRVAIVGAEELDAFDKGKWYGLLPSLLGADWEPEVSFVGPKLKLSGSRFPRLGPDSLGPVEVRLYQEALRDCWNSLDPDSLDLVMLFQPGFENHQEWFSGPDLMLLASSGIPVGVSSYGRDEYFIDREVLAAYGFADQGDAQENPFFMEMGHENVRWGHTLWRLGEEVPADGFLPHRERLQAVGRLSRTLAWWYRAGFTNRPLEFGTERETVLPGAGRARLIYLMGDLYARPNTGELLRNRKGEWQPLPMSIPADLLKRRPLPIVESLEGALWAAEVFERLS